MQSDPKDYYAILGVRPDATFALIRAAYRVRAMELHPDRNSAPSATREFQLLQEAYDCLSDEAARRAYDANGAQLNPEHAASATPPTRAAPEWHPVRCSRCGAISAQPRYREFMTVLGFFLTSRQTLRSGVFCSSCETKVSARATGITLLFGWWGVNGFIWSLGAILANVSAAWHFGAEDARLLCLQALYFASVGKVDLARAVATESHDLAMRKHPLTKEEQRKVALGHDVGDPLKDVRDAMASFLARQPPSGSNPQQLVHRRKLQERSFLIQLGMVAAAAAVIAGGATLASARDAELRAQREQALLAREGIERDKAQTIAEAKAASLKALEQPFPPTGTMSRFVPNWRFNSPGGLPDIRVTAPPEASYAIKLSDWSTHEPVLSLFVRAGEVASVAVPFGTYRITLASGMTWYGDTIRFGPQTRYSQLDTPIEFKVLGDQLLGHDLVLTKLGDGSPRPMPIVPDQF